MPRLQGVQVPVEVQVQAGMTDEGRAYARRGIGALSPVPLFFLALDARDAALVALRVGDRIL